MIDRAHPLPVARQARLLGLSRSSVYYEPVPTSAADLALMAAMDDLHMKLPFYGIRRIRGELRDRGLAVGRQHVATLMRTMGIEALHPKRRPLEAPARPQDLPLPSARQGRHRRRPSVVLRHHVSADGEGLLLSRGGHGLGEQTSALLEALEHAEAPPSASRHSRRRWSAMGRRRSSTPIRAHSSQRKASRAPCCPAAWRSAWTDAAAGWTTSSSNVSGEASSTRRCI